MTTHGSVTQLVVDLRSNDPSVRNRAAQLIWERYLQKLLMLASKNLDSRIRPLEDEEDVLQSMYKSFVERQRRGEYDLANRDVLWKLLVTITLNKTRNVANHHMSDKRDVRRTVTASPAAGDDADCPRWALEQMEAAGPSPEEAALLKEALERRLQALADPELRQIAVRKMEGWTDAEIADELDYAERTVERRLKEIRRKWMKFDDGTP
jgi:DNA-directed RNA polymerase specialized sigma24 family protein